MWAGISHPRSVCKTLQVQTYPWTSAFTLGNSGLKMNCYNNFVSFNFVWWNCPHQVLTEYLRVGCNFPQMFALWISEPGLFSASQIGHHKHLTLDTACAISPRVSLVPQRMEEQICWALMRNRNCGCCSSPAILLIFGMVKNCSF